jgi:NAD+ synthase (glutamine-hydrolysing)
MGLDGQVVAQGSQFSLADVETVVATVDLEDVRSYRFSKSRAMQAISQPAYERVEVEMSLSSDADTLDPLIKPSAPREIRYHTPEEGELNLLDTLSSI